jgi:glycosyltransferase involved in cell wall biosynthesis
MSDQFRICLLSGKMGDVDGVSLEIDKWMSVLAEQGHTLLTVAGRYANQLPGLESENQILLPEIGFDTPAQRAYEQAFFPHLSRTPPHISEAEKNRLVEQLTTQGGNLANRLYEIVQDHDIDVIVAQNTNAMPMTLPGALGMHRLVTERRMAAVFHHHDFWWERSRFSDNLIESLLTTIMPPSDLGIEHVVLTSYAAHILRSLKRVQPHVIPNCEDFENPVQRDEYNAGFRRDLGFSERDILIVQPTRIVRRKRLEDSVELVGRLIRRHPSLDGRVNLIVSLYQGDEPDRNYIDQISQRAEALGVPLHLISNRVSSVRGTNREGERVYTNRDVLANADMVTYLPVWEGFGNALLEAIAARVPMVVTTYLVYKTDIMVTGIRNIEVRDRYDSSGKLVIPDEVPDSMHHLLTHPADRESITRHNFEVARREFGYPTLRSSLEKIFNEYADEIRACRKRVSKSKMSYSV